MPEWSTYSQKAIDDKVDRYNSSWETGTLRVYQTNDDRWAISPWHDRWWGTALGAWFKTGEYFNGAEWKKIADFYKVNPDNSLRRQLERVRDHEMSIKNYERHSIAWDVDDTLCHFMAPALKELKRVMGKDVKPEECLNSMWLNDFLTKEELDSFLPYIFNPSFYAELKPTAILGQRLTPEFSALHDKYDFHVVTARRNALGRLAHRITSDWLHDQQVQVDGITISHPDQPKSQVMPMNTIAVVDDSSSVCVDAARRGLKVFLIDRPWNRHVKDESFSTMYRVTHENVLKHMARVLL